MTRSSVTSRDGHGEVSRDALVAALTLALYRAELFCLLRATLTSRWRMWQVDDGCEMRVQPVDVVAFAAMSRHADELERMLSFEVGGVCRLTVEGPPQIPAGSGAPVIPLAVAAEEKVAQGWCRCATCKDWLWEEDPVPRLYVVTGRPRFGRPGCMDADLAPLEGWAKRRSVQMSPFAAAGRDIAQHLGDLAQRPSPGLVLIARGGDLLDVELAEVRACIVASVRRLVADGWVVADAVGHRNHSLALPWSLATPSIAAERLVEVRRTLLARRQLLADAGRALGACELTSRSSVDDTVAMVGSVESVAKRVRELEASLPDPVRRLVRGEGQVWNSEGLGHARSEVSGVAHVA